MKVPLSQYLSRMQGQLKQTIDRLLSWYPYASVLGTDVSGTRYSVQKTEIEVAESFWSERGFVFRVYNGTGYIEHSCNKLDDASPEALASRIHRRIQDSESCVGELPYEQRSYPPILEEALERDWSGGVRLMPGSTSIEEKVARLTAIRDRGLALSEALVDFRVSYEEVTSAKLFVSPSRQLNQSYIWSQGYLSPMVQRGEKNRYYFQSFSGLKGPELIDEMESAVVDTVARAESLLDAATIEPGEYDVILSPDVAGLVAHEAFGHGVELDMFVKNRARAAGYIEKRVAAPLVGMRDGARSAHNVSSYFFDDEGCLGTDTPIIEQGVLKRGISDQLSALALGLQPTGNGKRESFERKAYARMTNTLFTAGPHGLADMLASVEHGYLLEKYSSGMEDPRNWGIQCVILYAREILNGELSGKIVSPVILTGYVPDLLQAITMVAEDVSLSGSGMCGKGYKEYVKVSSGGPYLKTRARLG